MLTKRITGKVKFLDVGEEEGLFEAVIATLNIPDHDKDTILPGAIGQQAVKVMGWGHNWQELPIGDGRTFERHDEARVSGRFFVNTKNGRETYDVLRELGNCEWSFGYNVLESRPGKNGGRVISKLEVFEVSPVLKGAGINTRLESLKARRDAVPEIDISAGYTVGVVKALLATFDTTSPAEALAAIDALEPELTPADVARQVMDMATPSMVYDAALAMSARPIDALLWGARQAYPDQTPAYHAVLVSSHLDALAEQEHQRQEGIAGVSPNLARCRQRVEAWAMGKE